MMDQLIHNVIDCLAMALVMLIGAGLTWWLGA